MKVLAVVSRDLEKGSTKYRLSQFLDPLRERGVDVEFVRRQEIGGLSAGALRSFDVLFNQKCLLGRGPSRRLLTFVPRVVFDFDDAIYTRPGRPFSLWTGLRVRSRLRFWLTSVDRVTTPNRVLASYARRFTDRVDLLPMALDLDRWRPAQPRGDGRIRIGWAGAPVNVPLIEALDPVLTEISERHPQVEIAIFSGHRPRLSCPFAFQPFRPGAEADFIAGLDIGLLPLAQDPFSRGKSPIKSLQYLACGVPVVGQVFGATEEILDSTNSLAVRTQADWLTALDRLIAEPELGRRLGRAGRQRVEEAHGLDQAAERLWRVLRDL